jgi:putative tryptophan/tyrosine transport system substrate-binding protein
VKRREFITLVGSAATWPLVALAQQGERMRRVGVLMPLAADDPEGQARVAAFRQGLEELGWIENRNVHIEYRWANGNFDNVRRYAAELVALQPDAVLAPGSGVLAPLIKASPSLPIVFVNVIDPVGAGFVESLARPGSNATGFTQFEYSTSGKWLELLKQIAPHVTRAAVLRDASLPSGMGQFAAVQAVTTAIGIEVLPVSVRDPVEIEHGVTAMARKGNCGLVVTGSGFAVRHRDLIIALAVRHKLPAVYYERFFVAAGGLISYGPDLHDQYRRAAVYVDRIFKGEKPADLPVQTATKFKLTINIKTAKALGLNVPPTLLARADEVIE